MIRRPSLVLSIAFVSCLALLGPTFAAAADDPDEKSASALRAGAWALQFGIADNFQLASFSGSTISLKHHTSDRSAWRLGVSSSFSSRSWDESIDYGPPDTALVRTSDGDAQNLTVALTRLRYPHPGQRVSAYYGAGPFVSFSGDNEEQVQAGLKRVHDHERWAVGANFVFGGEWFPARALGVHAEYRASLEYGKETVDDTYAPAATGPSTRRENSGWTFQGNAVRFGASWYF